MADEWSKPVKRPDGIWASSDKTQHGERGEFAVVQVDGTEVWFLHDMHGEISAPRDVVLRLLAAEASDRLGWVWEVDTGEWIASSGKSMWGRHAETGEPITYDDHFGFTADELVASLMGRFLLEDALREGRDAPPA